MAESVDARVAHLDWIEPDMVLLATGLVLFIIGLSVREFFVAGVALIVVALVWASADS